MYRTHRNGLYDLLFSNTRKNLICSPEHMNMGISKSKLLLKLAKEQTSHDQWLTLLH